MRETELSGTAEVIDTNRYGVQPHPGFSRHDRIYTDRRFTV